MAKSRSTVNEPLTLRSVGLSSVKIAVSVWEPLIIGYIQISDTIKVFAKKVIKQNKPYISAYE